MIHFAFERTQARNIRIVLFGKRSNSGDKISACEFASSSYERDCPSALALVPGSRPNFCFELHVLTQIVPLDHMLKIG